MEAVNWHRGIVNFVDHMEANFFQYVETCVTENFLISYPKCGRTWVRIVLGKYLLGASSGNPLELDGLTASRADSPNTLVTHDDFPHLIPLEKISQNKKMHKGKRICFLVRDPRDVLVSNFFQFARRKDSQKINMGEFSGTLSSFIRGDIGGLASLLHFYNVWAENSKIPSEFKIFAYEDFHRDPIKMFKETLNFLDFADFGHDVLEEAVNFGQFENLQKAEDANTFNDPRLCVENPEDPESCKIRSGKVGGYIDYLSKADVIYCNNLINERLNPIYERYISS